MPHEISNVKNIIGGGVGGLCAVFVGQPLDTIKVRLQTQPEPKPGQKPIYLGTWDCAIKTLRNEGIYGLYKGMAVPLIGVMPVFALSFLGYGIGKKLQLESPDDPLTPLQHYKAGMMAASFTVPIVAPGERVKCLLQVQAASSGPKLYNGPRDVIRVLYREGGIRSIYKGLWATIFRDLPTLGLYFMAYEWIKRKLAPEGKSGELSPLRIIAAGGTAGVISWAAALAPDVMKSRLQTAPEGKYPKGIRSVFMDIMRNERPSALFKGATPLLIRAFPSNACSFLGYEIAIKALNYMAPNL